MKLRARVKMGISLVMAGLVVVTAGCSGGGAVDSKADISSVAAATQQKEDGANGKQTVYPLTIKTHNYAKEPIEVTFEKAPEKVVAVWQNSVENMLELGLGDKIAMSVGVSKQEVLPELQAGMEKVLSVHENMPTKEEIIALQPDFILGWYSTFGEKNLGDVNFWHERKTATYMAYNSGLGEQNLRNEYDDILNLGKIFDVQEKAEAVVADMQAKVKKGQEYAKGKPPVNAVILEDEGDVFRIYGENSVGGDIARQLGANLLAKDKNEKKSAEDLVLLNPQMIFGISFGANSASLNDENCLDVFKNNPVYQNIDAVKTGKMYPTDLSLVYSPGIRVSNSIDFFLEHLYPDMAK